MNQGKWIKLSNFALSNKMYRLKFASCRWLSISRDVFNSTYCLLPSTVR